MKVSLWEIKFVSNFLMEVGVLQNMLASQELVSNAVSKVTGPESAQLRL